MPQGEKIPLGRSALLCIRKKLTIAMNLKETVDEVLCEVLLCRGTSVS